MPPAERNVGPLDRTLRLALGVVRLVTGYRRTCLLYRPFDVDTSDRGD